MARDPIGLSHIAMQQLARGLTGPGMGYVLAVLRAAEQHLAPLLDPKVLSSEEAVRVARLCLRDNPQLLRSLVSRCGINAPASRVIRMFELLQGLDGVALNIRWLREVASHPDPHVRSKAALLRAQALGNPAVAQQQLEYEPDPRIRANAIEGLWGKKHVGLREVLEKATHDKDNRVVANALIALWLLGAKDVPVRLNAMAGHASPKFRISAAWAMVYTKEPCFRPMLEALLIDSDSTVATVVASLSSGCSIS